MQYLFGSVATGGLLLAQSTHPGFIAASIAAGFAAMIFEMSKESYR